MAQIVGDDKNGDPIVYNPDTGNSTATGTGKIVDPDTGAPTEPKEPTGTRADPMPSRNADPLAFEKWEQRQLQRMPEGKRIENIKAAMQLIDVALTIGDFASLPGLIKELAKVGGKAVAEKAIEKIAKEISGKDIDRKITLINILRDEKILSGKTPAEIQKVLGEIPGWKTETLGKGKNAGEGWVLREYGPKGEPTGRMLRYSPGSTHHPEAGPYWRVNNGNGQGGIIPGGVE